MGRINQFSTEYVELVGENNIGGLNPFSAKVRADALAIMVEIACMYNKPVQELFPRLNNAPIYNSNYTHFCEGYEFRLDLEAVPCSLEWRFAYADAPEFNNGWCECLASMKNTSLRKIYSEVGKLFGIDATCPHLSHFQVCRELSFHSHSKTDCKDWHFKNGFVSGEEGYSKIDEYDFLGAQGFSLFKVILFESENGQEIQLPFTYWGRESLHTSRWLSTPNLMLSNYKAPYPLSALNLIESRPNAIILLMDDLPTAFALNRLLAEGNDHSPAVVAVSWYGGQDAFKNVDCSPLEGRDVVFMPQGSRASFLFASKVRDACKEVKVASFSVSQKHIYRFELSG
jgi:hypothetical protein